jgi:hypothetical protein
MTSQEFESNYKVLKQIAGGAGRSYTAQQLPSGRAVLVHVFESAAAGEEAGSLIERLPPRDRAKVLDSLTVDESLVFVTQVLEGFQSFEGWLRGRALGATDPLARPAHPKAQGSAGGEFTELFRPPERPQPTANESEPVEIPPEKAPGGFTELFSAPPVRPGAAPRPPVPSAPPVRVVELRLPTPKQAVDREPAPPPLRPNLAGGTQPSAPPVAPPAPRVPGDQIIAAPDLQPVSPPSPAWSGPSDFTRQLERGPHLGADVPPVLSPPEPSDQPDARKVSVLPLLLATNVITMLVTGLIVYFAFGRR